MESQRDEANWEDFNSISITIFQRERLVVNDNPCYF